MTIGQFGARAAHSDLGIGPPLLARAREPRLLFGAPLGPLGRELANLPGVGIFAGGSAADASRMGCVAAGSLLARLGSPPRMVCTRVRAELHRSLHHIGPLLLLRLCLDPLPAS